jgi:hypothetical protein
VAVLVPEPLAESPLEELSLLPAEPPEPSPLLLPSPPFPEDVSDPFPDPDEAPAASFLLSFT